MCIHDIAGSTNTFTPGRHVTVAGRRTSSLGRRGLTLYDAQVRSLNPGQHRVSLESKYLPPYHRHVPKCWYTCRPRPSPTLPRPSVPSPASTRSPPFTDGQLHTSVMFSTGIPIVSGFPARKTMLKRNPFPRASRVTSSTPRRFTFPTARYRADQVD